MRVAFLLLSAYLAVATGQKCSPFKLSWVLDVSGTITASNFENTQKFVKSVVEEIGIKNNEIGVASYGNYAKIDITCGEYTEIYDFNNGVDQIKRLPNQFTNTRDGLEKGEEILRQCRAPSDVPEIIILVTDGLANRGVGMEDGLIEEAKKIQSDGTTLLAIAVGKFSLHQLSKMVPQENIYVRDEGFDGLIDEKFIADVRRIVCNIIIPQTTTTRRPTTTGRPTTTRRPTTTKRPTTTTTRRPTTTRRVLPKGPICECSYDSLERFSCIRYNRDEINANFIGKCYIDKVRMAVFEIRNLITELEFAMIEPAECQIQLREQIVGYGGDVSRVFDAYDHCEIREYKLMRLKNMLKKKLDALECEIKAAEEGDVMIAPSSMKGM